MQVSGSTALVTGGGRRIGRAIVVALAQAGANVAVHYNQSVDDAAEAVEIARSFGVKAELLQADLAVPDAAVKLTEQTIASVGPVNIIVNSASAFSKSTLDETSIEEWDRYMAINLRAPFLLAKSMRSKLGESGHGKIVNLNDWRTARADRFAYGVSKAALSGLTRSLAVAMAPNVQVNELALGAILPPADSLEETGERVSKKAPAGRMGGQRDLNGRPP